MMPPKKYRFPLLPPAALSASGSRVEGLPSSQPVTQAPLLCCFPYCNAILFQCQLYFSWLKVKPDHYRSIHPIIAKAGFPLKGI